MKRLILCASAALVACSTPAAQPRESLPPDEASTEAAILQLAEDVFAAARARDAEKFANFFSGRPGFAYLINTRVLPSRDSLRSTFAGMLSRQRRFEPTWSSRHVQIVSPDVGILTGLFQTDAQRQNGEEWQARGSVTFVAVKEPSGWRIVNWHTSE